MKKTSKAAKKKKPLHAKKHTKKTKSKMHDESLQMISIRLHEELLDKLKKLADKEGLGYQPFIRQILTRHVGKHK